MEALRLASHLLLVTGLRLQQPRPQQVSIPSGAPVAGPHLQCTCTAPVQRQRGGEMRLQRGRCRLVCAVLDGEVEVEAAGRRKNSRGKAASDANPAEEKTESKSKAKAGPKSAQQGGERPSRRSRARRNAGLAAPEEHLGVEEPECTDTELNVLSEHQEVESLVEGVGEEPGNEERPFQAVRKLGGLRLRSEYKQADSNVLNRDGGEGSLNLTKTSSSSWMFQALSAQTRDRLQDLIPAGGNVASYSAALPYYDFEHGSSSGSDEFEEEEGLEQDSFDVSPSVSQVEPKVEKKRRGRRYKQEATLDEFKADEYRREEGPFQHYTMNEEEIGYMQARVTEQQEGLSGDNFKLSESGPVESVGDKLEEQKSRRKARKPRKSFAQESTEVKSRTEGEPMSGSESDGIQSASEDAESEGMEKKTRRKSRRRTRKDGVDDVVVSDAEMVKREAGGGDIGFEEKEDDTVGTPGKGPVDEQVAPPKGRRERRKSRKKLADTKEKTGRPVRWSVQAQLKEGQRLFLSGSVPELGQWESTSAVPMEEGEGGWEAQLDLDFGTSVEYNYFVGSGDGSADIVWRPGALLAFQVPTDEDVGLEPVVLHDVWALNTPENVSSLLWGQWWDEVGATSVSKGPLKDSAQKRVTRSEDLLRRSGPEQTDGKTLTSAESRTKVQIKEVDLTLKQDQDASATQTGANVVPLDEWLKRKIRRKVLPREEPWLMESQFLAEREEFLKSVDKKDTLDQSAEVVETKSEPEVHVEILINAPESTMQRMAILEDSRLVELLLEPVNSKVQVGNIYLGSVKQLLPGMIGLFVDIGSPRLALLDITRNIYPCTFPSITPLRTNGNAGPTRDVDIITDRAEGNSDSEEEDEQLVEVLLGDQVVEVDASVIDDEDDELTHHDRNATKPGDGDEAATEGVDGLPLVAGPARPLTVNFGRKFSKWRNLEEGMKIIVQVKKESMGKKGPRLTAYPNLAGRFWVVVPNSESVGISQKITGPERARLRALARNLQPGNFGLTVRTEAMGHTEEELEKDLSRLFETWDDVLERAEAAASAAESGDEDAVPVLLHRAMGQTLTVVRDFFTDKVQRMVVDSPQCYQEVTSYLAEVAPQLLDRVELYAGKQPIFDAFSIESQIDKFSSERVQLANGAYLVMQETEALVSIDVNGGIGMLNVSTSQKDAILEVNLAAARQIATELRLRDVGGIIVVDFIDMDDPKDEALVHEEMKKAIARDRSKVSISEISEFGVMEITRRRVRPSVTLMISDPCSCCRGAGRVEARETTLSKIERAIQRCLAERAQTGEFDGPKWPQVVLRVDTTMFEYLRSWKSKRITQLSSALKVWIILKVAMEFNRGQFQVVATGSSKAQRSPVDTSIIAKKLWTKRRRYLDSKGLGNKKAVLATKEAG